MKTDEMNKKLKKKNNKKHPRFNNPKKSSSLLK